MEELNLITLNAISGYYNNLKYLGYVDCEETNNVILLSFINDLINTFPQYITNSDYDTILKAVQCLSDKSCFISAPHFLTQESLFKDSNYYKQKLFKLSEDSLFRLTEDNDQRIID